MPKVRTRYRVKLRDSLDREQMEKKLKLAMGSDHHGVTWKAKILDAFGEQYEIQDFGPASAEASCDYPDYAREVAAAVSQKSVDRGILICGSGVGMAITANKFSGVRAAVCESVEAATLTRQHNNINVLCLSGTVWQQKDLLPVVQAFLETEFEGGRHQRRIDKINEIEKTCGCFSRGES